METEHQVHFGRKFYLDKEKGYWISTDYPRIRAHVWVWKNHYGDIPKGSHIHHKDENKSNNSIDNLECLKKFDHLSLHARKEENIKRSSEWCNKIRPLTKAWHASEEGRKWHSDHGVKVWDEREPFQDTCKYCGAMFTTKTFHQCFCSNNCKSAHRRASKVDSIEFPCETCGKILVKNKYAKRRFCSTKCRKVHKNKIHTET